MLAGKTSAFLFQLLQGFENTSFPGNSFLSPGDKGKESSISTIERSYRFGNLFQSGRMARTLTLALHGPLDSWLMTKQSQQRTPFSDCRCQWESVGCHQEVHLTCMTMGAVCVQICVYKVWEECLLLSFRAYSID